MTVTDGTIAITMEAMTVASIETERDAKTECKDDLRDSKGEQDEGRQATKHSPLVDGRYGDGKQEGNTCCS